MKNKCNITADTRKQNLSFRKSILRAGAPLQEKNINNKSSSFHESKENTKTNSSHVEEAGRGRVALTLSLSAPASASAASGARLSAYLAPLKESYEKDRDIDRNAI